MKLFSLYDTKAQTFTPPYMVNGEGLAIRAVVEMLLDPRAKDTPPCKYPEDFTLFCLGEFDESTGKILSQVTALDNLLVLKTQADNRRKAIERQIQDQSKTEDSENVSN